MQEFIKTLDTIANIITPLLIILGLITSVSKRGKKVISDWFKKITEPQTKATLCVLRSNVRNMCMIFICKGYLTKDEWEDLTEASEAYDGLGGNSYTHRLVERALALPIKERSETVE